MQGSTSGDVSAAAYPPPASPPPPTTTKATRQYSTVQKPSGVNRKPTSSSNINTQQYEIHRSPYLTQAEQVASHARTDGHGAHYADTRSARSPVRPISARRESNESGAIRRYPGQAQGSVIPKEQKGARSPPPLPVRSPRPSNPSVFSGREGSTYSRRAETVSSPPPAELQLFAHHCRLFYFSTSPPQTSADFISSTLAALPPAHRAAYTRLQSSLRSLAHLHHLQVRISAFHALMSSTVASGSLSLPARADLTGPRGKAERVERLRIFINTWCSSSVGGLEPFFRGLWSFFRLQSRGGLSRGGAGPYRAIWEVDDAVFLESGGPEFMHEAILIIKGVLGLDDQPLDNPPKLRRLAQQNEQISNGHSDPSRTRAPSDPFTDATPLVNKPRTTSGRGPPPTPPPSRRRPAKPLVDPLQLRDSASKSADDLAWQFERGNTATSPLLPTPSKSKSDSVTSLVQTNVDRRISEDREYFIGGPNNSHRPFNLVNSLNNEEEEESTADDIAAEEADLDKARYRLWSFPAHIDDEEIEQLMALFPSFITRKKTGKFNDVKFPLIHPGRSLKDLEMGHDSCWQAIYVGDTDVHIPKLDSENDAGVVRSGTGRIWTSTLERGPQWNGGFWFRFRRWWRRLFGIA